MRCGTIVEEFNTPQLPSKPPIEILRRVIYNREGKSVYSMAFGIVGDLLTATSVMLTPMAILRRREVEHLRS